MLIRWQNVSIQLGNQVNRIEHILIMLKSQVPKFY